MSKQSIICSSRSPTYQRGTLRNLKLSKINKQIEQLLQFSENQLENGLENKENRSENIEKDVTNGLESCSFKNGRFKSDWEVQREEVKERLVSLEEDLSNRIKQIDNLIKEKQSLKEMVKELQSENQYIKEELKSLQSSPGSRDTCYKENYPSFDDFCYQFQECQNQSVKDHYCPALIQLHNENSLLLNKIMQLTYVKKEISSIAIQTESKSYQQISIQTVEDYLGQVDLFCKTNLMGVSVFELLSNFRGWIERYLQEHVEQNLIPLRCQLQLFEQIIKSNKRQHQEKVSYLTKLLEQAQKTILGLMKEMKGFERQAKTNYSLYLSVLKENKREAR